MGVLESWQEGKRINIHTMFTVTSMTAKSRNKLLHTPSRDLSCKYDVQSCWDAPHQSPSPMLTDIYAYCSGKAMQVTLKMSITWSNLCKSVQTASHLQHVWGDTWKNTHRCGRWLSLEEETGVLFASVHFKDCLKTLYNHHIPKELFAQAMMLCYVLTAEPGWGTSVRVGKSAGKREGRQGSAKTLCGNVTDVVSRVGRWLLCIHLQHPCSLQTPFPGKSPPILLCRHSQARLQWLSAKERNCLLACLQILYLVTLGGSFNVYLQSMSLHRQGLKMGGYTWEPQPLLSHDCESTDTDR